MWSTDKEIDNARKTMAGVASILSQPFHDRVREILIEINQMEGIKVKELLMGNGVWGFGGSSSTMEFEDGEIECFDDYINGGLCGAGLSDDPKYIKRWPKLPKLAKELEKILMFLSDEPYMELISISPAEMEQMLP